MNLIQFFKLLTVSSMLWVFGNTCADSNQSGFLDPLAEASIEEAMASAYGLIGAMHELQDSMDPAITLQQDDVYEFRCGSARVEIGTVIVPEGTIDGTVDTTTVVLGSVYAINTCP